LQTDLNNVSRWLQCNSLSLNIDKSAVLSFSQKSDMSIRLHGSSIRTPETVKYLGVVVDKNLNFKAHIDNRLSQKCGLIYMLRKYLNVNQLLTYYSVYIKPIVQYGVLVYGCACKTDLNRIKILQRRIMRVIFRLKGPYDMEALFLRFKIFNVFELHVYELYKIVLRNAMDAEGLTHAETVVKKSSHDHNLRSGKFNLCVIPKKVSSSERKSVNYRVSCLYNTLERAKALPSLSELQLSSVCQLNQIRHHSAESFILGNAELISSIFD